MARRFDPLEKETARVLGSTMAYVDHGKGDPIVLLHGNPTSSYLWRDVIPELAGSWSRDRTGHRHLASEHLTAS